MRSKEPASQAGPWGRATPRWSVAGQSAASAASMAGLPGSRACVGVGPPLSPSGPRSALATTWSLAAGAHVASVSTLWPPELRETGPLPKRPTKHPISWLWPITLLATLSDAPAEVNVPTKMAAGPEGLETFAVTVVFVRLIMPSVWKMAPPYHAVAVLPLSVLLVRVTWPRLRMPPPTLPATLPLIVLRSIVTWALKKA